MIEYLILSVLSSFGLAIALTEKKREWPVRRQVLKLKYLLRFIHRRAPEVLNCAACTSFWCALFTDNFIAVFSGGSYFCWPLSGFMAFGLTWTVMQVLYALNK